MEKKDLIKKLKEHGIHTKAHFYTEAFSRNIGLLTTADQAKLSEATVAIPGMGGVGGAHLMAMIRMGVGKFHISDFDTFEVANFNRQYGATVPSLGQNKLDTMVAQALSVNPYAEIKTFPQGISAENLDEFLDGVDVVIDSLDYFEFDIRRMLFNRARKKGVYVVTAGPIGFSSAMLVFSPHEGMGFDEYFNIVRDMTPQDHYLSYAMGLAPRSTQIKYMDLSRVDFTAKAGPSSIAAVQLCAGMVASEAMRIILGKGRIKPAPHYFQFDFYRQIFRKGKLRGGNRHPIQKLKKSIVNKLLARNAKIIKPEAPEIPAVGNITEDLPEPVLEYILKAGIQAPSGDNVQPWKFKVRNNSIDLYLDKAVDNSFFNVQQIASIISCGAVIENLKIAATLFGLDSNIHLLPEGGGSDHMASVTFTDGEIESDPLSPFIWERCTNRKLFNKEVIPESNLETLSESVSMFPGVSLHLITGRERLKSVADMVYLADRIRTEHRPMHEHLNKMIRFTKKEAIDARDGFPLKNLEAGIAGEIFLKATRSWAAMTVANYLGVGRLVAMHAKMGILSSSGVGLVTVKGTGTKDLLIGGQALERTWLNLAKLGISFQPMAAVTLFWMRWLLSGENDFLPKHRPLLNRVWDAYKRLFPEVDFEADGHVLLFRFGVAKPIRQRTIRKYHHSFYR